MRNRNFKLKKKYMILMDYDYSHIFSFENSIIKSNFCLVLMRGSTYIPKDTLDILKKKFNKNLMFVDKSQKSIIDIIYDFLPDVIITIGWRRIVSEEIFGIVSLSINIHPAILPEYRGYHPLPYLLKNNEIEHGITAHLISDGLDEGDIILQKRFIINKFTTYKSLVDISLREMPVFFLDLIRLIEENSLYFNKQDVNKVKVNAKRRIPDDSELDSDKTLRELFDDIRACDLDRFPPFFFVQGEKVYIKVWRETTVRDNQYDI